MTSLAPGQSLGHYRIVRAIGQGGMGAVFHAEDTKLDRQVALKVLPPEVVQTAPALADALAAAHDHERVRLEAARAAEGARDPSVAGLMTDPLLVGLHADPRWKPLLEKVGFPTD